MSRLHSTRSGFGEQHLPLQALLGLLSATGHLAQLLPAPETETETRTDEAEPSATPDPFVALLLGVVCFRRTLLRVLGSARSEQAAPEDSTPSPGSLRDLLR